MGRKRIEERERKREKKERKRREERKKKKRMDAVNYSLLSRPFHRLNG